MAIVPNAKPEYTKEKAEVLLKNWKLPLDQCYLIAVRGYYKRSMANPLQNDIGIYDDALLMISPDHYSTWNFNTDPSSQNNGRANVCANQIIEFEIGIHNRSKAKSRQYKALIQDEATFKIYRYNQGIKYESYIGINLHAGGINTTSSLGCMTIPPDQWKEFIKTVEKQMKKYNQKKIKCLVIEF